MPSKQHYGKFSSLEQVNNNTNIRNEWIKPAAKLKRLNAKFISPENFVQKKANGHNKQCLLCYLIK